ncbi:MAG: CPBP family glutamic-type intramembrane protease [Candidatus Humimicrobiaceae bacterium]
MFFSFILGLTWSFITIKTKSIFWSMISHIIFDSVGLGAFAYIVWFH